MRSRGERHAFLRLSLLMLIALSFAACATSFDKRGVYHKVRTGDSIWRIARAYRVDVQQLAEFNNILNPEAIEAGTRLYIPSQRGGKVFKKLPFGTAIASEREAVRESGKGSKWRGSEAASKPIEVYRGTFDWPIEARVSSPFGMRDGRRHDGIDISAESGTPIHASAAGRAVFVGEMRGYGNLVLLRHDKDFFTAYAHNSVNRVKKDHDVQQGEVIAKVGRTGRASAPHLHFEIRHGQTARNPLFFLPEKGHASSAAARRRAEQENLEQEGSEAKAPEKKKVSKPQAERKKEKGKEKKIIKRVPEKKKK